MMQQPNLEENEEAREGRVQRQGQKARSECGPGGRRLHYKCRGAAAAAKRPPLRPSVRRPSEQKDISRSSAASSKRETERRDGREGAD